MPKYWGKQIFTHGVSPKWVKSKRRREKREEERLNDGNNNGQLRIANAITGGARKAAWANSQYIHINKITIVPTVVRLLLFLYTPSQASKSIADKR